MKKILSVLISTAVLFSTAALGGCQKAEEKTEGKKPIIAVSIVPEATFAEAVCGELAEIITMIPPGSSPENYEPSPAEMEKFSKAKLFFSIGVPTEEANILPNVGDVKIVKLQEKVAAVYSDLTFEEGGRDPHIWLSPKRAKVMVQAIADEMSTLDPENKDTYQKNAAAYIAQLDTADKDIVKALENIENKGFVVYHPAFGYFADDYGLTMVALEEEGKEATPEHLQEVIDYAKEQKIKVIFYQAEIDSSQSEAFAEELGGKTVQLEPLSADYIENLKKIAKAFAEVNS